MQLLNRLRALRSYVPYFQFIIFLPRVTQSIDDRENLVWRFQLPPFKACVPLAVADENQRVTFKERHERNRVHVELAHRRGLAIEMIGVGVIVEAW